MYDISNLRLAGFLMGVFVLAWVFVDLRRYRVRSINRASLVLFALAGIVLATFPRLVDAPAAFFGLNEVQGGRLIALLILSVAFVWLLAIRNRNQLLVMQYDLTATMRHLAMADFRAQISGTGSAGGIWVVIPVLNEATNIGHVVKRIPRQICGVGVQVLVVDDGSTDGSAETARAAGAAVARMPLNCGGGTALLTGFEIALKQGAAAIVTMDGDGQHDPAELESLVTPIVQGQADFVIGSRMMGSYEGQAGLRTVGVRLFSLLINLLTGSRITDCASGFRAIAPAVLDTIELRETQYHTPELIIGATKRRMVVVEFPIHIRSRMSGMSKKGTDLRYGWMFVRSIVRAWLR